MAIENVKAFYKELEANQELQKKIAAADAAYNGDTGDKKAVVEAIVLPIAKESGFDFTAEQLIDYVKQIMLDGEISEDALASVAGGTTNIYNHINFLFSDNLLDTLKEVDPLFI